jgi:hypothetical protein
METRNYPRSLIDGEREPWASNREALFLVDHNDIDRCVVDLQKRPSDALAAGLRLQPARATLCRPWHSDVSW